MVASKMTSVYCMIMSVMGSGRKPERGKWTCVWTCVHTSMESVQTGAKTRVDISLGSNVVSFFSVLQFGTQNGSRECMKYCFYLPRARTRFQEKDLSKS